MRKHGLRGIAIFAYDTGESMVSMNAPARRVGFFPAKDTFNSLTTDGWRLFDAAVKWATAAKALFTVGALPLSLRDDIAKTDPRSNLHEVIKRHTAMRADLDVEDRGVLRDVDTPADLAAEGTLTS